MFCSVSVFYTFITTTFQTQFRFRSTWVLMSKKSFRWTSLVKLSSFLFSTDVSFSQRQLKTIKVKWENAFRYWLCFLFQKGNFFIEVFTLETSLESTFTFLKQYQPLLLFVDGFTHGISFESLPFFQGCIFARKRKSLFIVNRMET